MAQTTGALPSSEFTVEVSTDGVTWIDISGTASVVEESEQARKSGEAYTATGKGPVLVTGKLEAMETKISSVYTEEEGEAFEVMHAIHIGTGQAYFRYATQGGAVGANMFTACGDDLSAIPIPLIGFTYPGVDASSGDPIMNSFTVKPPAFAKSTIS